MERPIVIGLGEILWDMLPDGKKAGGAPVNFAYHASQHGAEGWGISAVGDDELGRELQETAAAHGINLELSVVGYPTSTVKVTVSGGQPRFEICEDVAWDHLKASSRALELASRAGAISFGTLAQRHPEARAAMREIISHVPEGALVIYDINLRQHYFSADIVDESLKMSNILKINDEEVSVVKDLLGIEAAGIDDVCRVLLRRYALKMVVLTAGARFSTVFTSEEESTIETPSVEVVDTVGAGDSFSGALIASLLTGKTIAEAHRIAVDTAAYVCTQAGAWTPRG